jgi:hypothetical protein
MHTRLAVTPLYRNKNETNNIVNEITVVPAWTNKTGTAIEAQINEISVSKIPTMFRGCLKSGQGCHFECNEKPVYPRKQHLINGWI